MKLYRTENYYGNPVLIGNYDSRQKCSAAMIADIESRHQHSYYTRHWFDENEREIIDYGSHTIFYVITGDNNGLDKFN